MDSRNQPGRVPNVLPNNFSENVSIRERKPKKILLEHFMRNQQAPIPKVEPNNQLNIVRKFASQPRGTVRREVEKLQNSGLFLPSVQASFQSIRRTKQVPNAMIVPRDQVKLKKKRNASASSLSQQSSRSSRKSLTKKRASVT